MRAHRALMPIGLSLTLLFGSATLAGAAAAKRPVYLSLGTSLSVGVEPDPNGVNRPTREGYADQLRAALLSSLPDLKLHKLGCLGETTASMIAGGLCSYEEGSQLAEAVDFLQARGQSVVLVTLDIGANDIESCGSLVGIDPACVQRAFTEVPPNLWYILTTLRAAAPGVPIVAMNYYSPFAAAWPLPLAQDAADVLGLFNGVLSGIYEAFGVPVADVAGAFHSADLTPDPALGGYPLSLVLVCQWTWMCAPLPVGPNIHANVLGYAVIAEAFHAVLPPLH